MYRKITQNLKFTDTVVIRYIPYISVVMRQLSGIHMFAIEFECFLTPSNNVEPTKHNSMVNANLVQLNI